MCAVKLQYLYLYSNVKSLHAIVYRVESLFELLYYGLLYSISILSIPNHFLPRQPEFIVIYVEYLYI